MCFGQAHGTVLGHLLFLVKANNLSKYCQHSSVSRVLGVVDDPKDVQNVQTDLNYIIKLAGKTIMQFQEFKFESQGYENKIRF